jgi:hypothetical protein
MVPFASLLKLALAVAAPPSGWRPSRWSRAPRHPTRPASADGGGGGFGRMSGSACIPANWGSEPRYLQSHLPDHWIKIWMEDRVTHQPRVFDLPEIYVSGDKPIQFWFKRTDGTWWCWRELGPRKRWKLAKWAHDLIEVRVRASAGAGTRHRRRRGLTTVGRRGEVLCPAAHSLGRYGR